MVRKKESPTFGMGKLLRVSIPAYMMPLVMPGIPAYVLGKADLLRASYTTIGLSSLTATIICFVILAVFQKRQVLIINRFKMMFLLGFVIVTLASVIVFLFNLQDSIFDIAPSAFIGTAIVSLTNPLKKLEDGNV